MPDSDSRGIPELTGAAPAAVLHRGSHFQIIASAGSGKTEAVSHRVADVLAEGIAPEGIVAFTRWSVRKLADYLSSQATRPIEIGRERLRPILHRHRITFQRTKTWKESNDPQRDTKLARIEYVSSHFPQRVFVFAEFGPLVIRPQAGAGWAPATHPRRLPANYHKLHGVWQLHGCYSMCDDQLWGVVRRRESAANSLAAFKSNRAAQGRTGHRST